MDQSLRFHSMKIVTDSDVNELLFFGPPAPIDQRVVELVFKLGWKVWDRVEVCCEGFVALLCKVEGAIEGAME